MRKGLAALLAFAIPILLIGLGIGWGVSRWLNDGYMEQAEARQEALRDSVRAAEARYRRAQARADSLDAEARTDSVYVTQYITRIQTDTAWLPAEYDTAAIVEAFPRLLASRDSLAEACDTAIASCWGVVAAKDTVITGLRFTLERQEERCTAAEENWAAATRRIRRMERWDWLENVGYAILGGLGGYGAARLSGGG